MSKAIVTKEKQEEMEIDPNRAFGIVLEEEDDTFSLYTEEGVEIREEQFVQDIKQS